MRYGFPRQARLTRSSDYEAVYRGGERVTVFPLRVRALCRDPQACGARSRLGLSLSRRVGPAHVRNCWKRAIREAFRLYRHRLPAAYDVVVGVAWESTEQDTGRVEEAFLAVVDALRRAEAHSQEPGCGQ